MNPFYRLYPIQKQKVAVGLLCWLQTRRACLTMISACFFFTISSGLGQTTAVPDPLTATEFLPPSPNSTSLGRFGGAHIGLACGTMQKKIELLSFGSSNLNIPISLSYASNGIKVDEVGSRIGMSWNLQAGGIITRTVLGQIDEYSQRSVPAFDFNLLNRAYLNFMETLVSVNGQPSVADGEPDLFTFNFAGYIGKFILDKDLNPVLLTHSGLKIVRVDSDNFTIVTPQGIKYNFGGANAVETLSKSQAVAACGKTFSQAARTAFYLREIIHPNGEVISLRYSKVLYSYAAGISSSLSKYINGLYSCSIAVDGYSNTTCVTSYTANAPVLEEISSNVYGKVSFLYNNRSDLGDKLLVGIQVFKVNQSIPYKSYTLEYLQKQATMFLNRSTLLNNDQTLLYRPFLISVIEKDADNILGKKYKFSYSKAGLLPPRLSYAQDHYGYFNGKINNTFYSLPHSAEWQLLVPEATANREPDENFVSAGMLSKIVYPTGGSDSIVYEANTEWGQEQIGGSTEYFALTATGVAPQQAGIVTSDGIPIVENQQISVVVRCDVSPEAGGKYPGSGTVNIYEDNVLKTTIVAQSGSSVTQSVSLSAGKTYKVKITASRGPWISCSVNFSYKAGSITTLYTNKIAPGARVAKIITDTGNGLTQQKKYTYASLQSQERSTGMAIHKPSYEKIEEVFGRCYDCVIGKASYYTYSSSSVLNIYRFSGAPVYYSNVFEEDLSGHGGIEYQFSQVADEWGQDILGKMPNPPFSSNDDINGLEINRLIFKRNGTTIIPVLQVYTHYKTDSRINNLQQAYVVRKKYVNPCPSGGDPPTAAEITAYDFLMYNHKQRWVYADTVRTRLYDASGTSFDETLQISFYDNDTHAQLSRTKVIKSDGSQETLHSVYPDDYPNGCTFIDNMKSNSAHLSGFPIEQVRYREAGGIRTILYGAITKYYPGGQGRIDQVLKLEPFRPILSTSFKFSNSTSGSLPYGSTGASPFVSDGEYITRLTYSNYDIFGNPRQITPAQGRSVTYIWSYGGQFPVAKIYNADFATVQSALGGEQALTSFTGSFPSDTELRNKFNNIGSALPNASLSYYTYDVWNGLTSITEPSGRTTYFYYDGLGRLTEKRDWQQKIINVNGYHYKQ